jgi:hypothetical protein
MSKASLPELLADFVKAEINCYFLFFSGEYRYCHTVMVASTQVCLTERIVASLKYKTNLCAIFLQDTKFFCGIGLKRVFWSAELNHSHNLTKTRKLYKRCCPV